MARTDADIARTRKLWAANKPGETAAPAYVPDPPAWWQAAIALAVALIAQSSVFPWLEVRGARVSLVTLIVAWYALRTGTLHGLTFGLIAGSCEDAFAGSTGAAWTFATAIVGVGFGRLARMPLADTKIVLVPAAAVATLVRDAAFFLAMQLEGRPVALGVVRFHATLWQSALDALVAFVALLIWPQLGTTRAHRR